MRDGAFCGSSLNLIPLNLLFLEPLSDGGVRKREHHRQLGVSLALRVRGLFAGEEGLVELLEEAG